MLVRNTTVSLPLTNAALVPVHIQGERIMAITQFHVLFWKIQIHLGTGSRTVLYTIAKWNYAVPAGQKHRTSSSKSTDSPIN